MDTVLMIVYLFVALALIGLVLLQHGKGADAGAAFGSGASATVFGARGSASFLTRATAVLATLFFVLALVMSYMGTKHIKKQSVLDRVAPVETPAPAAPTVAPSVPADVPVVPAAPATPVPAPTNP